MDSKMNIWDKQQQNWIKEILSKSGTELKEISDKNGNDRNSIIKRQRNQWLNFSSAQFLLSRKKMWILSKS